MLGMPAKISRYRGCGIPASKLSPDLIHAPLATLKQAQLQGTPGSTSRCSNVSAIPGDVLCYVRDWLPFLSTPLPPGGISCPMANPHRRQASESGGIGLEPNRLIQTTLHNALTHRPSSCLRIEPDKHKVVSRISFLSSLASRPAAIEIAGSGAISSHE